LRKTVSELVEFVGGTLEGDGTIVVTGVAGLREAQPEHLSFLAHPRYTSQLADTRAKAIVLGTDVHCPEDKTVIRVANANEAFGKVVALFAPPPLQYAAGIAPEARIDPTATVDTSATILPFAVISAGAWVGPHTVISSGCFIGQETTIGANCLLYPNVVVRERCVIGNRVILHAGAVIGADGFGYDRKGDRYEKIPQVGIVQIDDDVEIGANTTVDRARFGRTWIKKGVKIDNLVQIAHNVVIDENTAIAAQAGISGSTIIGRNVLVAGQVGTVGHISVGDRAILGAQSGINHDVPAGQFVFGYPAQEHKEAMQTHGHILRLPRLAAKVRELEAQVKALQQKK
jgi:UDP-3-O-[3-hydroxymyristoyl] glucosamine N-acyltransferase